MKETTLSLTTLGTTLKKYPNFYKPVGPTWLDMGGTTLILTSLLAMDGPTRLDIKQSILISASLGYHSARHGGCYPNP